MRNNTYHNNLECPRLNYFKVIIIQTQVTINGIIIESLKNNNNIINI